MDIMTAVKASLRISHDKLDTEVNTCIGAAKTAMLMAGVQNIDEEDDYTATVIKTFARSWFNFEGQAEQYRKLFESQLVSMSLNGRYRGDEL